MTQPDQAPAFDPTMMRSYDKGMDALERGLAALKREWHALIDRIKGLLERVEHELNSDSVWATISEWWTETIADAVRRVQELVTEIEKKVGQILDALQKAVSGSVPIGSLFAVGLDWATKVNPALSSLGPDLTGSGKIDNWRGPTKLTYEKRVLDQVDAVESSVQKVKATSTWLAEVAKANTAYMVQLANRAVALAGVLTAVVIDGAETAAGAVPQIVITLQHVSELAGEAVTQVLEYVLNLANRFAEVLQQITDLASEYGDRTGLPDGKWPQPVNT